MKRHATKLLLAGAALLYFVPLGWHALWDSDEGRYAEIGREMLELKDWVSPHLNYVLYFEKPPLMYWLIAISETVFGKNAFGARFWCAVFAVLTVGVTYIIGKKWKNERTGLIAGAIVGSSLLYVALSQFLALDMALTFWMTLELFAFSRLLSERLPTALPRYVLIAGFAAAGGVLTKGPVAIVLPVVILLITVGLGHLGAQFRKISWGPAILVILLIAGPWYVLISLRHPFFVPFFFIREHLARFFTNVEQRNQPFYFFILTLAVGFLPWTVFLPRAYGSWFERRNAAMKRDPVGALLVVWSIFIVIFFSLSHSKLVGYVLPVFPPMALLVADAFDGAFDVTPAPRWIQGGLAVLCFFYIGVLIFIKWPTPPSFFTQEPASRLVAQSGFVVMALGIGVFVLVGVWGMRRTSACFAGLLLFQLFFLISVLSLARELDADLSGKAIAVTLGERAGPQNRIVVYGISYENNVQSLLFYARRRLVVYGEPGELAMGAAHEPRADEWFVPEEKAESSLVALPFDTWVVTDERHWKGLKNDGHDDLFVMIEHQGPLYLLQKIQ